MQCPFKKGNNMCYEVISSPNPCNLACILKRLLETLTTIKSIDGKVGDLKPEINLEPIISAIEAVKSEGSVPEVDLAPIKELKSEWNIVKALIAEPKDYSEDISKLKQAIAILADDISEIKERVKEIKLEGVEEAIAKAVSKIEIPQKVEKSLELVQNAIKDLNEKFPTII